MPARYTMFVDESGIFECSNGRVPRGMRVAGGVLLPVDREAAERLCAEAVSEGLRSAGAPWWEGDVHAAHMAGRRLAVRLDRNLGAPPGHRSLAAACLSSEPGDPIETQLDQIGEGLKRSIRRAIGAMLRRAHGRILYVADYGAPPGGNLSWKPMITALCDEVCLACALPREPANVALVIAHRAGATAPAPRWKAELTSAAQAGRLGELVLTAEVRKAEELRGLQVADFVVHRFGPGGGHADPVSAREGAFETQRRVDEKAGRSFDLPPGSARMRDQRDPHNMLQRSLTGAEAIAVLERLDPRRPPLGVYAAAVESAQALARVPWGGR
jgi:hypothetical protein